MSIFIIHLSASMRLHTFQGYIQNIHLVEYEHGCLLLDGCCSLDLPIISDYFSHALKRPISDLKVVVVTHMHPDHAGCALKLKTVSNCIIVSGEFSKQWYSGIKGHIAHIVDMTLALWVAGRLGKKRKNLWYPRFLSPDRQLADNARLPFFEDWTVIRTPGHTDRDISLVNNKEKMIYVADLIVSVKKRFAAPFPIYLPNEYKHSLHRLLQYTGYDMLMAHVPKKPIERATIEQLIKNAPNSPQTNVTAIYKKIRRFKQRTMQN